MNPFGSELFVSLLAIGLNYAATFKLPATSLLKDPVTTLWTTVPILFAGHLLLVILSNLLRGTSDKALKSAFYSVLATMITTGVLHILTVLFGAPLIEYNIIYISKAR
ncbi:hypothetical protein RMATCC62417_16426 [Rhizopus microsporus]|nr:hypothetical protein RMATCC62417_16426 [Rhizopus microsporus]